ncbi:uncharacterized protein LOC144579837 [Callithrix jacchus]
MRARPRANPSSPPGPGARARFSSRIPAPAAWGREAREPERAGTAAGPWDTGRWEEARARGRAGGREGARSRRRCRPPQARRSSASGAGLGLSPSVKVPLGSGTHLPILTQSSPQSPGDVQTLVPTGCEPPRREFRAKQGSLSPGMLSPEIFSVTQLLESLVESRGCLSGIQTC